MQEKVEYQLLKRIQQTTGWPPGWSILRLLFLGIRSDASAFSKLSNMSILPLIWSLILDEIRAGDIVADSQAFDGPGAACQTWCYPVKFPPPKGICINMLPFDLFKKASLPTKYRDYWKIIECCWDDMSRHPGMQFIPSGQSKVVYLTIHESQVLQGSAQRRPGLHLECSAGLKTELNLRLFSWVGGIITYEHVGGIYMCTNVSNSCALWPYTINHPEEVVNADGSCENLRPFLSPKERVLMEANQLYWIADCTPHETLASKSPVYRQFFRLIVGDISAWYEEHSTKNELGFQPPKSVLIVKGKKHKDEAGFEVDSF